MQKAPSELEEAPLKLEGKESRSLRPGVVSRAAAGGALLQLTETLTHTHGHGDGQTPCSPQALVPSDCVESSQSIQVRSPSASPAHPLRSVHSPPSFMERKQTRGVGGHTETPGEVRVAKQCCDGDISGLEMEEGEAEVHVGFTTASLQDQGGNHPLLLGW